jgi:hypothetical protein
MTFFVFSDFYFLVFGAFVGASFGPEISGPLWGALGSFVFGKLIQFTPGPLNYRP